MRAALVRRIALLGPMRDNEAGAPAGRSAAGTGTGDLATLATRGIDALDGYFARYLPRWCWPSSSRSWSCVAVLAVDWISAAIMAVTLPLIPVFMALVGMATRSRTDRQLRALQVLSGHFLDVVSGLATLKIFGRSRAQVGMIREVTDGYRRRPMTTLRITFLSSLVLELLASVSVALIAVAIGLRLLDGHIDLRAALCSCWCWPRRPTCRLRQLGADYHASAEGMSAADQVFEVLEPAPARPGDSARPCPTRPRPGWSSTPWSSPIRAGPAGPRRGHA